VTEGILFWPIKNRESRLLRGEKPEPHPTPSWANSIFVCDWILNISAYKDSKNIFLEGSHAVVHASLVPQRSTRRDDGFFSLVAWVLKPPYTGY